MDDSDTLKNITTLTERHFNSYRSLDLPWANSWLNNLHQLPLGLISYSVQFSGLLRDHFTGHWLLRSLCGALALNIFTAKKS